VLLAMLTGRCPESPPGSTAEIDAIGDARLRAVLQRATAEAQAERFASAGEMAAALTGEPVIGSPPRPPFRPAPFEETDHPDFFGRDREIKLLIEHVLFRRAVIYVAPSGTGKTSLLRAGMSPQLAKLGIRTVYVACRPGLPDSLADAITPGCT